MRNRASGGQGASPLDPLLLTVLVGVVYWRALDGAFLFDDVRFVSANPVLHVKGGILSVWSGATPDAWPLSYSLLWAEVQLWGEHVVGFHVVNVALHVLTALGVLTLLRRLGARAALATAVLFAVHPVATEAVAWIFQAKTLLAAVLAVTALVAYTSFLETERKRTYALALATFVLALLAKTSVVALPLLLPLLAWYRHGTVRPRDWAAAAPFAAASVALGAWAATKATQDPLNAAAAQALPASLAGKLALAGKDLVFYGAKALVPSHLSVVYPRWTIDTSRPLTYAALAAVVILAAALVALRHRIGRGALVAFAAFVLALVPVLGFVPISYMTYAFAADHWQYLALPALLVIPCEAGRRWLPPRAFAASVIAAASVLLWSSHRAAARFTDNETLWKSALAVHPNAELALYNLGKAYENQGRSELAAKTYAEALRLSPDDAEAANDLGAVLLRLGRPAEAEEALRAALAHRAGYPEAASNLVVALTQQGRLDDAAHFVAGLAGTPAQSAVAHANLAGALAAKGRAADAVQEFEAALRLGPPSPALLAAEGGALARSGQLQAAEERDRQAAQLDPAHAAGLAELGQLYFDQRRYKEAQAVFEALRAAAPRSVEAAIGLGNCAFATGDNATGLSRYREAAALAPGNAAVARVLHDLQP